MGGRGDELALLGLALDRDEAGGPHDEARRERAAAKLAQEVVLGQSGIAAVVVEANSVDPASEVHPDTDFKDEDRAVNDPGPAPRVDEGRYPEDATRRADGDVEFAGPLLWVEGYSEDCLELRGLGVGVRVALDPPRERIRVGIQLHQVAVRDLPAPPRDEVRAALGRQGEGAEQDQAEKEETSDHAWAGPNHAGGPLTPSSRASQVRPKGPACRLSWMFSARSLLLAFGLIAQACTCSGDDTGPARTAKRAKPKATPLVEKDAWVPVDAANDPFAGHRPAAEVDCRRGLGWLVEDQGFEIRTLGCNYAMFSQPSRAPIAPGDLVVAMLYHFDLVAAEPATAHVALAIGERVIWEKTVEIPGRANVFNIEVPADFSAPAGTPVYFHLHNHGRNNWTLASMGVAPNE